LKLIEPLFEERLRWHGTIHNFLSVDPVLDFAIPVMLPMPMDATYCELRLDVKTFDVNPYRRADPIRANDSCGRLMGRMREFSMIVPMIMNRFRRTLIYPFCEN
jgi:hypothetical protein